MENQTIESVAKSEKLDEVITSSGLQLEEANQVKENYLPFLSELQTIKEQSVKINFESPTDVDEKIARDLRLKVVKIRTGAGTVKDARKKIHLLKGNLEQAAYNLIKADCELIEEAFTQVEKARQIAEAKRKAELKEERLKLLTDYTEVINPDFIDLANMNDEDFTKLMDSARLSLQTKRDAEAKAEAERLAAIEAERKRIEEQRIENERLKKEAEEKEKQLEAERKKAAEEAEKVRIENEKKLEVERAKAEEIAEKLRVENIWKLAEEKRKADAERKIAEEKAAKLQAEADAKLKAEQEKARKEKEIADAERAKLEAELKAKKDAEEAERKRIETEEKKKLDEAKKLAKAGDKARLKAWAESFQVTTIETSTMKPESVEVYSEINDKFQAFKNWANNKIDAI